ncbi:hypothetical protein Ddye_009013 [Dipteronia dyeriana]|uniref:Peptidyl-prolyl cis-trans isomerase n=1 Tax=Dipteronia dyeriana TaxID=168575 RepID=A0AAE0CLX0_9ROSI|nr:hypothetical protein Ddye_009013 [Dipteronia dyeriana]
MFGKKKKGPTAPAVEVWEDYPKYDPLSFCPENDTLDYVSGSKLPYSTPWWIVESGINTIGKPLHYKESTLHCVVPEYMVDGGDTQGNGTGGESIFGLSFAYKNFVKKHIGPGILLMEKTSTRGNGSQFFICTGKAMWLDHKQIIFDHMVEGFDILKAVDKISSISGLTSKLVMVIDCNVLY